ncbi:MAG: bifunctional 3,4-dihydroxy-2-butanone-4-phosphate synthase/GTP cyclohydrolase II [Myxococcota bacterium]
MNAALTNETIHRVEEAIRVFRDGGLVVMVDDEERENEGDIVTAAELITPEKINFMAKFGRGLICLSLTEERCDLLNLPLMVSQSGSERETAFTVSIEAREGVTTGISAYDRARTIQVAVAPDAKPEDIVQPGHIFPLRARRGGVLERTGHTEGSVDLARMAGLFPAAVICEIMNDEGNMARRAELEQFCERHNLVMISIADLIEYRLRRESLVRRLSEATLVSRYGGTFEAIVYGTLVSNEQHLILKKGNITPEEPILVRVHTASVLNDVFGSLYGDSQASVPDALKLIEKEGRGVFLYMNIPMQCLTLDEQIKRLKRGEVVLPSLSTGKYRSGFRDFGIGAQILRNLGIRKMRLITNNPKKIIGISAYELEVVERVKVEQEEHSASEDSDNN